MTSWGQNEVKCVITYMGHVLFVFTNKTMCFSPDFHQGYNIVLIYMINKDKYSHTKTLFKYQKWELLLFSLSSLAVYEINHLFCESLLSRCGLILVCTMDEHHWVRRCLVDPSLAISDCCKLQSCWVQGNLCGISPRPG